jgi:hypothetical protein
VGFGLDSLWIEAIEISGIPGSDAADRPTPGRPWNQFRHVDPEQDRAWNQWLVTAVRMAGESAKNYLDHYRIPAATRRSTERCG